MKHKKTITIAVAVLAGYVFASQIKKIPVINKIPQYEDED